MTDSPEMQDNKSPGAKNDLSPPHVKTVPSTDPFSAENKSAVITEKFLAVAKEKSSLESVILSQNDIIKGLEKENEKLTLSLRKFVASHKSMKEKLLDFDLLRNMEISELRKQIGHLIADNKKLISDKDSIISNLERDRNTSMADNQEIGSLVREKRELEERLRKTLEKAEDEQFIQTASDKIRDLERELSLVRSQKAEVELDRDEAKAELYNSRVEIDHLKADKAHVEENLRQKVDDYSTEIANLKTDIDELTSATESRISVVDGLNVKVDNLSSALIQKDSELHEKIPALLEKINSLSQSIDMKMEENSLFAKELFDLNVKISALNEEMIAKDEILLEISEDYKKQKDEIEALHGAHELTLRNLVFERDMLKKEGEDLRNIAAIPLQQLENERQETKVLQDRISETLTTIDKLGRENAGLIALISEKDAGIIDLQRDVLLKESKIEEVAAEHAERLSAMQEKLSVLNQQLHEKDETLAALTAERSQAAEKDLAIAELQKELLLHQSRLEEATAEHASNLTALREKITFLNQQLLNKQELLTVMASEHENEKNESLYQTDSLRKEIKHLNEEMDRLIKRGLEQENNLAKNISLLDVYQKEKAGLEEDLAQATEKINQLVLEQDRLTSLSVRQEQALSDARAEINVLQANAAVLKASQAELEKKLTEKQDTSDLGGAEREELQKTALAYQETFEHLKQEIVSLNKKLAEKEQGINLLLSERDGLAARNSDQQITLDQSLSSIRNLQMRLDESMRNNNRVNAEKIDLANAIERLQGEINALNQSRAEEAKVLKDDLSAYGRALADLRLRLEQSLNENTELRSKLQASHTTGRGTIAPAMERREVTLPARVEKVSSTSKRTLAYTLLALLMLGGIGFSFYAFNAGLITLPMKKPAVREEVKKELDYNDMFSLLTKVSASDDFKFQATLVTESLVLKSDIPGEMSLFDFQNHIYFKVSISAPRGGLDVKMADDPYSLITLTAGADAIKPLSHRYVKDIKIFFRKEEPVSIMFYCAFPRTALTPDRNTLSLSFKNEKGKADIVWDLNSLRANDLSP